MKSIFIKIKKWIRRKYIIYKYKKNFNTGKLIYLKNSDRGYGLTSLILKDVVKYNTPILVPTLHLKDNIINELYDFYKYDLNQIITPSIRKNIKEKLVIVPVDNIRGRNIKKIFVDNSCTEKDVYLFLNHNKPINIINGFVTKYYD